LQELSEWACIYIKYLQIFCKLEAAYDQMLQPQKRQDMRKALEACMGRMLEIRHWLVRKAALTAGNSAPALQQQLQQQHNQCEDPCRMHSHCNCRHGAVLLTAKPATRSSRSSRKRGQSTHAESGTLVVRVAQHEHGPPSAVVWLAAGGQAANSQMLLVEQQEAASISTGLRSPLGVQNRIHAGKVSSNGCTMVYICVVLHCPRNWRCGAAVSTRNSAMHAYTI
jgi:hypothetical protein